MEADGSIYVTETDGTPHGLRLVLAEALGGDVRITVRESTPDVDEDLNLLVSGAVLFVENAPRTIAHGRIAANFGFVLLLVGDDVTTDPNSEIVAGETIDVFGDHLNADAGFGTTMLLRGRIVAGCVVAGGTCGPATTNPVHLTQVWGHTDVDTFQLGDPTGVAGGTAWGAPGYVFIGPKTRIRGSHDLDSSGDDGEDRFRVFYLQDADVVNNQLNTNGAGHTLTLDGQADTDYYEVHTTGSRGNPRHYIVNALDTGASDDGVDELAIYGFDSTLNGNVPGSSPAVKHPGDDVFLLRAAKCIDTESAYALGAAVPSSCTTPTESALRPAFVALLHGDLQEHRLDGPGDVDSPIADVQRINYDAALNGRLLVYGLGGNDSFFTDDNSAITTLDGGAGSDTFQIGQVFGSKRDAAEGALLPQDTFPVLIATTRGWLSPGIHAPLVAQGGTGNDEFVVYSNQAELRLEGDDGNDLFVVRAFALAAVCDTNADAVAGCQFSDIDIDADPATGLFPADSNDDGICDTADADGFTGFRRDNNDAGVCNSADAHRTTAPTQREDDEIPLDAFGVARPRIGLGFSVDRPLDIRTGAGEDEVQYNVNAPVSVDGGTGFDKVAILGTEFPDDFVITEKGVFGAGVNVRFENVEVVEVDGLEGDDEFFIISWRAGVALRVIGGLGSDTINVAGDVVEDIVVRELEGVSASVNHLVRSLTDLGYDGLLAPGIDLNVASPALGVVVITESGNQTSIREGGPVDTDSYTVRLAAAPVGTVFVTVSAARSPQEERDGVPAGDSMLASTTLASFFRTITLNGAPVLVPKRA